VAFPDPVTTGLVTAGALQIAKQAQEFLAAICGHPDETVGTMLGNIAKRRLKNAETVVGMSHLILLNIGATPKEVPLNVLQPLLESASLQEETELQEIWANLLANAADTGQGNPVEPAFPAMLKELSLREVRFLNALFSEFDDTPRTDADIAHLLHSLRDLDNYAAYQNILRESDGHSFQMTMDVLERNGIVSLNTKPPSIDGKQIREATVGRYDPAPIYLEDPDQYYSLTRLGYMFVRACRKPKS
jgi:hypothetical protein